MSMSGLFAVAGVLLLAVLVAVISACGRRVIAPIAAVGDEMPEASRLQPGDASWPATRRLVFALVATAAFVTASWLARSWMWTATLAPYSWEDDGPFMARGGCDSPNLRLASHGLALVAYAFLVPIWASGSASPLASAQRRRHALLSGVLWAAAATAIGWEGVRTWLGSTDLQRRLPLAHWYRAIDTGVWLRYAGACLGLIVAMAAARVGKGARAARIAQVCAAAALVVGLVAVHVGNASLAARSEAASRDAGTAR